MEKLHKTLNSFCKVFICYIKLMLVLFWNITFYFAKIIVTISLKENSQNEIQFIIFTEYYQ